MTSDSRQITTLSPQKVRVGQVSIPTLFALDDRCTRRYLEFFAAQIRNPNTRAAYSLAARCFAGWCDHHDIVLTQLTTLHLATYVEEIGHKLAKPSVKQHLAALRMLFDWLVVGQVIPFNPATSVRGPKYVVRSRAIINYRFFPVLGWIS